MKELALHAPCNIPHAGPSRIASLDAIRQIAAFIVLTQHFLVIFEVNTPFWLRTGIFDAKAAVTLFFVLSGFVLALSIRREPVSLRGYLTFGVRRVLRLYPIYIAATLVSFVVLVWVKTHGGFSRPLALPAVFLDGEGNETRQWLLQFTLVMPGMRSDFANPPVWTLMTEAKVAVIFPFLAWAVLRLSPLAACLLTALLVIGSDWADRHIIGTVALLGQFALGTLIARMPGGSLESFKRQHWLLWLAISVTLYSAMSFRDLTANIWIAYYLCAFGSAGLIIATLRWNWLNTSLTALQRHLRVDLSYGLYILHFPIMIWLRKLSGETATALSVSLLFIASLFCTIILSVILMYLVERPAITLGKCLTSSRQTLPKGN